MPKRYENSKSAEDEARVAIIILTLNGLDNLRVCLGSLLSQTYRNCEIYLYDQASSDGSIEYVKRNHPSVNIYRFDDNCGYAKGNNFAMKRAFSEGAEYCLLLNDDTEADPRMVEELVKSFSSARATMNVGLVQPTILLFEEREKLNTIGNAIHYLGFGYCKDFRKPFVKLASDRVISSASGAALLVSKAYYEDIGGLDEDFFMYNEDQNYSWRGLLRGYSHLVSAQAILFHKYEFRRNKNKIFHSEKNRIMIVWENYSAMTLFLLFPAFIFAEQVALGYSIIGGYFIEKLRSYGYLITHMGIIGRARKAVQKTRTMSDAQIIRKFESELMFEELKHPLLTYCVNPIFKWYYAILVSLLVRDS